MKHFLLGLMLAAVTLLTLGTASADDLNSDSRRALQQLVAQNPDITVQTYGAIGCQVTRSIYSQLGYRYLYVD